jgi:hypothetical protein
MPRYTRLEICILSLDLQLNGFPQGFTDLFINSNGSSHLNKEDSFCVLCIFHM